MLKYDYEIVRDEGDSQVSYVPKHFPKSLEDIVYIEGPNSTGKSTLLNILALAFHGLHKGERKELNQALYNKLRSLMDSKHQKLKFEVRLVDESSGLELVSRKPGPDSDAIELREKCRGRDRLLAPEGFFRKYDLIYDIPDNPTERLSLLLHDIKNLQNHLGNQIASLRGYIRNVIEEIRKARDPQRLEELRDIVTQESEALKAVSEKLDGESAFAEDLKRYFYARFFKEYKQYMVRFKGQLEATHKEQRKKTRQEKKLSKEARELLDDIRTKIRTLDDLYGQVTPLLRALVPKRENNHLELWQAINIPDEIQQHDIYNNIKLEAAGFTRILNTELGKIGDEKAREIDVLEDLRDLLQQHSDSNMKLPGLDRTIPEFIALIETRIASYSAVRTKMSNIRKATDILEEICSLRDELVQVIVPQYKCIENQMEETQDGLRALTPGDEAFVNTQNERKMKQSEKWLGYYRMGCAKLGIDETNLANTLTALSLQGSVRPYESYTEQQLQEKVDDLLASVARVKQECEKKQRNLEHLVEEIKRIEKKAPHRYQDNLADLEELFAIAQTLEKRFRTKFPALIDNLIAGKVDTSRLRDDEITYYDFVARFLARRVDYIRHIDAVYSVSKIDMVDRVIWTDEGKRIMLSDLGTGQSQSAYLVGLLSRTDDRKLIVLFDEVAMMDSRSLEPIYEKLGELHKEGRLLLGIVVQRGDRPRVQSKV